MRIFKTLPICAGWFANIVVLTVPPHLDTAEVFQNPEAKVSCMPRTDKPNPLSSYLVFCVLSS